MDPLAAQVRFRPGIRLNLIRATWPRLKMPAGSLLPLGEYVTDATGNCDELTTLDNQSHSNAALLSSPVDRRSPFGLSFAPRFAPMAEQCALARLRTPIVCCGAVRHCGRHTCGTSYAAANRAFWEAGQQAGRRTAGLKGALLG